MMMSGDYLIQAANDIIQGQHIVATVLEEAGGETGHTVLLSMVVRVHQMFDVILVDAFWAILMGMGQKDGTAKAGQLWARATSSLILIHVEPWG
jgi:hypothetical protein